MNLNDLAAKLGDACYGFLGVNFLFGLYCVIVIWRRLRQLRFRSLEAETAFIDYTTTKLPPVEAILDQKRPPENIAITEIEPIFSLKGGILDIHKTSEPVLVDWEQPDDVPTTTQASGVSGNRSVPAPRENGAPPGSRPPDPARRWR